MTVVVCKKVPVRSCHTNKSATSRCKDLIWKKQLPLPPVWSASAYCNSQSVAVPLRCHCPNIIFFITVSIKSLYRSIGEDSTRSIHCCHSRWHQQLESGRRRQCQSQISLAHLNICWGIKHHRAGDVVIDTINELLRCSNILVVVLYRYHWTSRGPIITPQRPKPSVRKKPEAAHYHSRGKQQSITEQKKLINDASKFSRWHRTWRGDRKQSPIIQYYCSHRDGRKVKV